MATKPPALTDSFDEASQVPEGAVVRNPTERVLGMGVTPGGSLDKALQQHHQQRVVQAKMYRTNAATAIGKLAKGTTWDPTLNGGVGGDRPLTEQEIQDLTIQKDDALQKYGKLVGVNPEAKGALDKAHGIIDFILGRKKQQQQAGRPGGMAAPPTPVPATQGPSQESGLVSPSSLPQATVMDSGVTLTPPPAAHQSSALEQSIAAPFAQHEQRVGQLAVDEQHYQSMGVQGRRALVKQMDMDETKPYIQDFILTGKITGNMGAALRPPPRPVGSYTTSVLDARSRASKTGEVFLNVAGEPIPIDDLDDSMGLKGMQTLDPATGQWQVRYEPFSPNQSTVTADNQVFAVNPMDKSKIPQGTGTYLGAHNVPVTSTHTAPGITIGGEIGPVTTSTTRTPMTGGVRPGPGVAARSTTTTTPGSSAAPSARPAATPPGSKSVPQSRIGAVPQTGKGNEQAIPFGAANQLNLRIVPVREAATQLFGDPTQPDLKGLADYAHLAENTKNKPELANALQLTFKHMEQREKAEGGLMNILSNYLGKPQALVDSEMSVMQDVIGKLSPEDQEAYNAEMAAFGTIIGLRSLTRAPATEMTAKSIEREVPLFGVNTFSKTQFYDKMARLAENVYNGSRSLPLPKSEKDYYAGKIKEYRKLAGGRPGGISPAPTPEGSAVPKTSEEYLSKFGIKPAKP